MKHLVASFLLLLAPCAFGQQVFYQSFTPGTLYNAYGSGNSAARDSLGAEAWTFNVQEGQQAYVAQWSATRFVPSETFTLTSITIPLITASRFDQADVNHRMEFLWFGIYSDANGSPDNPLFRLTNPSVGQIASYNDGTLAGSTFTAPSTFIFNAGQTYWMVLGPDLSAITPADGSTGWSWRAYRPPNSSGAGSVTSTSLNPTAGDWSVHTSRGAYNPAFDFPPNPDQTVYSDWEGGMSVMGVSAVPEPSTYAVLAGVGALGVVMWRRRRAAC